MTGDEVTALESVLKADVWRERLMSEETELNASLVDLEATTNAAGEGEDSAELRAAKRKRDDVTARLGEVQQLLVEMEAETAPARAAGLLAGLGFSYDDQQRPTKTFSGGWRMRLSLARALFCKPDLLVCDLTCAYEGTTLTPGQTDVGRAIESLVEVFTPPFIMIVLTLTSFPRDLWEDIRRMHTLSLLTLFGHFHSNAL